MWYHLCWCQRKSQEITWPDGIICYGSSCLHISLSQVSSDLHLLWFSPFDVTTDSPELINSIGEPKSCLSSRWQSVSGGRRSVLVCFTVLSFASGFVRFHVFLKTAFPHSVQPGITNIKSVAVPVLTVTTHNVINVCTTWVTIITIKGLTLRSSPGELSPANLLNPSELHGFQSPQTKWIALLSSKSLLTVLSSWCFL